MFGFPEILYPTWWKSFHKRNLFELQDLKNVLKLARFKVYAKLEADS